MNPVRLELPYPPSVNTYWRRAGHRIHISHAGVAYRQAVGAALLQADARLQLAGRLSVEVELYPPDRRRRDIDNAMKCCLDSLAHGGLFLDDSQIDRLAIERKGVVAGGKMVVSVEEVGT